MKLYFRNLRSTCTSCKNETQERNVIKQNEKEGKKNHKDVCGWAQAED